LHIFSHSHSSLHVKYNLNALRLLDCLGFRVSGFQGLGLRVEGFRVSGFGFRVSGLGCRV